MHICPTPATQHEITGVIPSSFSCKYTSSASVSEPSSVSSPQRCSTMIIYGPPKRSTPSFHRTGRWWCRRPRSRSRRAGETEGTAGLQPIAYRMCCHPFSALLQPAAAGDGPSATLTLLASVGCASLARSRAIKKRARHDLRGGTGTAAAGDHNS